MFEAPPGLQGILDDFFQRPLCSVGEIEGRKWCGDVGLPGPDQGKGGKYLVLPPDFTGDVPPGYFTFRSRTYGVFVFWRGFFQDPNRLEGPVKIMEQTRIYPLGKQADAKAMQFPDASGVPVNMLYPRDGRAFDLLKRFIDHEYVDPANLEMRGMLAAIGIIKDQPFLPDAHARAILDQAARRASEMGHYFAFEGTANRPGGLYYADRHYVNGFPPVPGTPDFVAPTYTDLELRSGFLHARLLRLDNGQRFPSLNAMDKPVANPDGSTDLYFGPKPPGEGKNWLATVPGKGFFVILRLYGPTQAFYDQTWKPGDLEKMR
jgi:hypothetical protein